MGKASIISVSTKGDGGNGFSFDDYTPQALYSTMVRALTMFKDKKVWKQIQLRGMKEDFSWKHSADLYIELYGKAIEKRV